MEPSKSDKIYEGAVEPALRTEFPQLALHFMWTSAGGARTPQGLAMQLDSMSDRLQGSRAIALRQEPVPLAYRTFVRQIGLDPDQTLTPVESVVAERLFHGGLATGERIADSLSAAILDTGVALWAYRAEAVVGKPSLRAAIDGERLGAGGRLLEAGTLVVASERAPIAELFGEVGGEFVPRRQSRDLLLCVVRVPGVPRAAVYEALWACAGHLTG